MDPMISLPALEICLSFVRGLDSPARLAAYTAECGADDALAYSAEHYWLSPLNAPDAVLACVCISKRALSLSLTLSVCVSVCVCAPPPAPPPCASFFSFFHLRYFLSVALHTACVGLCCAGARQHCRRST